MALKSRTTHLVVERQQAVLAIGHAMRGAADSAAVHERGCSQLAAVMGADHAHFVDIDLSRDASHIAFDCAREGLRSLAGQRPIGGLPWTRHLLQDQPLRLMPDARVSLLIDEADRAVCARLEVNAWLAAPIFRGGQLVAALVVCSARARRWLDDEVWVLDEIAERIWYVLARVRAEEALQERTRLLERQTQQLRWLASELTLTEHRTREQISKSLHDHVQQLLFGATLTLQRAVHAGAADALLLQQAQAEIREAMGAARSLSQELFPPVIQAEGLPMALEWLGDWVRRKYSMPIIIASEDAANPAADDARILLFESVRELVFNAIKHASASKVTVTATLTPDEMVSVSVADDGVGFDPETTLSGLRADTGLGLFSIRERLSFLGGSMSVDASPGRGARLTLLLPRRTAPPAVSGSLRKPALTGEPPSSSIGAEARHGQTRRLRILLADDHALVRDGLKELISTHPELEVVGESVDGQDALRQAQRLKPDVVVMDVSMPVMDGIAATRRLRQELPSVQVFGLSTDGAEGAPHPIVEAGARAYFSKRDGARDLVRRLLIEHAAKSWSD